MLGLRYLTGCPFEETGEGGLWWLCASWGWSPWWCFKRFHTKSCKGAGGGTWIPRGYSDFIFHSELVVEISCLVTFFGLFLTLHFISWTGEGNSDPTKLLEALQKRVKRQENLLQKCKEVMRTHKERSAQLSTENETLQEQLQERLQELEKIKVACSWPYHVFYFIAKSVYKCEVSKYFKAVFRRHFLVRGWFEITVTAKRSEWCWAGLRFS